MLQQDKAEDYVIATGIQHSVRECISIAADCLDMQISWRGEGLDEKGIDEKSGKVVVAIDPRYFRPTEVDTLLGDPSKARQKLGWKARYTFEELISEMVEADLKEAERDRLIRQKGYSTFNHFE